MIYDNDPDIIEDIPIPERGSVAECDCYPAFVSTLYPGIDREEEESLMGLLLEEAERKGARIDLGPDDVFVFQAPTGAMSDLRWLLNCPPPLLVATVKRARSGRKP